MGYWCDSNDSYQSPLCLAFSEIKESEEELKSARQEVATLKLALETANQMRDSWEEKHRKLKERVEPAVFAMTQVLEIDYDPDEIDEQILTEAEHQLTLLYSTLNEG